MLPSSGYFKNLTCPYYLIDNCNRVYCHFKHRKPEQIISYVPTPVHLLKDKKTESIVPDYKPTPIDKLRSVDSDAKIVEDREIKKVYYSHNNSEKYKKNSVYESIEQKLSSIFDSETSSDEDNSKKNPKKDDKDQSSSKTSSKTTNQDNKLEKKKDEFSYIEELDLITKETKTKRDLQDKEIVNKIKQKKKKTTVPVINESEQEINPISKKARIAHKTSDNVNSRINVQLSKKNTRMSPAQVMVRRFSTTLNDEQEESKIESSSKKRIAHTPTIKTISSSSSSLSKTETSTQQIPKRPILPLELGSKVPNTIRQRYLNLIIDEYLKINQEHEDAYQNALTEEKNVFKRSPSKNTYINLAVNAIRRIRNSMKTN